MRKGVSYEFKNCNYWGGKSGFARTLFTDIMSVPEFHDIEVAFTDINPDNLEKVTHLCQRDLDSNAYPLPFRQPRTGEKLSAMPDTSLTVCV